jgi:hypothetical protein
MAAGAEFALIEDDYNLTVAALGELGVESTADQPIPDFEELTAVLADQPGLGGYLGGHATRGFYPELTFHVIPEGPLHLSPLVGRFDEGQEQQSYVWADLWHAFDFDPEQPPELSAAVMLNDSKDPVDHDRPANDDGEPGLVHTRQTVLEQRASLAAEAQAAAEAGEVWLDPMSFSQYLVAQAKRRLADRPFLDASHLTATRFSQLPGRNIGGTDFVLDALVFDKLLYLHGSTLEAANPKVGVRRAAKLA